MAKILVLQKDAIELCSMLPNNSIDLFLYDPPYGIGQKFSTNKKSIIELNPDTKTDKKYIRYSFSRDLTPFLLVSNKPYYEYLSELLKIQREKLKQSGVIAIMLTQEIVYNLWKYIPSNLYYHKTIYWLRTGGSPHWKALNKDTIVVTLYPILILSKSKRCYEKGQEALKYLKNSSGHFCSNLWDVSIQKRWRYYTAKPINLIKAFVEAYSPPGGVVVDCFCGSGSTGEGALQTNRLAILSDIGDGAMIATKLRLMEYAKEENINNIDTEIIFSKDEIDVKKYFTDTIKIYKYIKTHKPEKLETIDGVYTKKEFEGKLFYENDDKSIPFEAIATKLTSKQRREILKNA